MWPDCIRRYNFISGAPSSPGASTSTSSLLETRSLRPALERSTYIVHRGEDTFAPSFLRSPPLSTTCFPLARPNFPRSSYLPSPSLTTTCFTLAPPNFPRSSSLSLSLALHHLLSPRSPQLSPFVLALPRPRSPPFVRRSLSPARSPFVVRGSRFTVRPSPFAARRSTFAVRCSPLADRRWPHSLASFVHRLVHRSRQSWSSKAAPPPPTSVLRLTLYRA